MMILLRLLLIGGIVFLAFRAWRMIRPPQDAKEKDSFAPMVKCAVCEQHVPKQLAQEKDGLHYCDKHLPTDMD